jgi:hypothetical protein
MRVVRTIALLTLALAMSAGMAFSQSLAEVAKKEKKRRESNRAESKTVITDRELTRGYGGLPATLSPTATSEEGASAEGESDTEGGDEEAEDETRTQEYWQNRVNGAKEKISRLETQLNSNDWGEGQRVGVNPLGQNNLAGRQQTEQELQAARAELEAIRAEARRAGVPPGWVR